MSPHQELTAESEKSSPAPSPAEGARVRAPPFGHDARPAAREGSTPIRRCHSVQTEETAPNARIPRTVRLRVLTGPHALLSRPGQEGGFRAGRHRPRTDRPRVVRSGRHWLRRSKTPDRLLAQSATLRPRARWPP